MAKTSKKAAQKASKELSNIVITQSFPGDLYTRLSKYQKAKKFSTEQEVVRIGLHDFLERQGF